MEDEREELVLWHHHTCFYQFPQAFVTGFVGKGWNLEQSKVTISDLTLIVLKCRYHDLSFTTVFKTTEMTFYNLGTIRGGGIYLEKPWEQKFWETTFISHPPSIWYGKWSMNGEVVELFACFPKIMKNWISAEWKSQSSPIKYIESYFTNKTGWNSKYSFLCCNISLWVTFVYSEEEKSVVTRHY